MSRNADKSATGDTPRTTEEHCYCARKDKAGTWSRAYRHMYAHAEELERELAQYKSNCIGSCADCEEDVTVTECMDRLADAVEREGLA